MILLCFESFMSFECHSVATLWCHWGLMGFPIHTSERIIRTEIIFSFWICISSVHHLPLPPSMASLRPLCICLLFYQCLMPDSPFHFSLSCDAILQAAPTAEVFLGQQHSKHWCNRGTSPWILHLTEYILFDWVCPLWLRTSTVKGST